VKALVIRPTMRHRVRSALERNWINRLACTEIENSTNAAHRSSEKLQVTSDKQDYRFRIVSIENPKWPDDPMAKSLNPLKPVSTGRVKQVEQRHDLRPWVRSAIPQKAVVTGRVSKASLRPLPLESARIAALAQFPGL